MKLQLEQKKKGEQSLQQLGELIIIFRAVVPYLFWEEPRLESIAPLFFVFDCKNNREAVGNVGFGQIIGDPNGIGKTTIGKVQIPFYLGNMEEGRGVEFSVMLD